MQKIIKIFLFCLIILPFNVYADTPSGDPIYCGSGWGNSQFNGNFYLVTPGQGDPWSSYATAESGYSNQYLLIVRSGGNSQLWNVSNGQTWWLANSDNPVGATWTQYNGSNPIGTITEGSCYIPPAPIVVATSTINMVCTANGATTTCNVSPIVGNLSFLLTVIITLMFLVVVAFLFNTLTDKKPWKR